MKFSIVNEVRQEAQPGASGQCPLCGQAMIAKCGEIKIWHWAHKGLRTCDTWWENETEWHRSWKGKFPLEWQEVIHFDEGGEKHIADVKTQDGWVIEFQHSNISSEESRSREVFYRSLIWVVDGMRRKKDLAQFSRSWASGHSYVPISSKRRLDSPKGALLQDWLGSSSHVFFDFGGEQTLWWLFPQSNESRAYVQPISRAQFIRALLERSAPGAGEFDSLVENFCAFIAHYETPPQTFRPMRLAENRPVAVRMPIARRRFRL
jgi:hypothetical protein